MTEANAIFATDEFSHLDATAQAELVRRGEVSPIELVEAAIARIEALNPNLNAVITPLFDKARTQALAADLPAGLFRGVPLLLKDYLCQTAGDPYYEGMRFLRDLGWRSPADTYLAQKFRAAGFIFLGKTNLPERAAKAVTEPDAFGPTRNPWDLRHTPDGSSGGSAAAVASGMVPVAHANDGLGSIRGPASACGLVGLKPSRGRVSLGPGRSAGLLGNVAEFVLTRSVRDTAAILDAIAGPMPGDLVIAPPPQRPYRQELQAEPGPLKVGLLVHDPFLNLEIHPEWRKAVEQTGRVLESLGMAVEYGYPPQFDGPTGLGLSLRMISASAAAAALDGWSTTTGKSISRSDVEADTWAWAEEGRTYTAVQIHEAYQRITAGACGVLSWWQSGFDLLITPTRAQPPLLTGEKDPDRLRSASGLFTMPFNLTGQPAISLPLFWSQAGLPIGVQLVADYGREDILLQVAARLEQARPWSERRPGTS